MLKPQDLVVASALVGSTGLSYEALAAMARLSVSEAHGAVRRLVEAGLVSKARQLYAPQFLELLTHGARYVWPLEKAGGVVRGLPTAAGAAMFASSEAFPEVDGLPYVWACADDPRAVEGIGIKPLYPSAVNAASMNESLYAVLALIDAVRVPNARERNAAIAELRRRLRVLA